MSNAECRPAILAEKNQIEQLWRQCFDDTDAFVDWYFMNYYDTNNTLVVTEEDKIVASAQVIPKTISVRNHEVNAGYIVGVDTASEYRNKGYAKMLLRASLMKMRDEKRGISLLMPFETQFYYRYGWQHYCFHQLVTCNTGELRLVAKEWGRLYGKSASETKAHIPELETVYQIFTQNYSGYALREESQWMTKLDDMYLDHGICYILYGELEDSPAGYFFYYPAKNNKIIISEIAWISETARKALLYYISELIPEDYSMELHIPEGDWIAGELATNKRAVVRQPFLMARISQVETALEALSYPEEKATFRLSVTDNFADWNSGNYIVQLEQGKAKVTKETNMRECAGMDQASIPTATLSVEALCQMIMGNHTARQLLQKGLLCCTDDRMLKLLELIWPATVNYVNEYF